MAKKPEREIERWVTWHGRRIPIYKGESKAEVAERMKASFKQGAEKGKEGRPETAKSVQDKQQKAKKASEKRHQKHLNMENKGHTPRRIENYKKAVEEETKAHEAAGKALEKSKIQGVKFNRPYDKKSTPSSAGNTAYAYGNGHITRVPAGVKPLAHGGETYNFIAHVKGQLKPNYFKTEKEAQDFLDNAGNQSKVDRWGRKDWYDDERRKDIKKFRDQNPVTEYKDLSKLPSKIADDEVLLIKQTNKKGELEYYHGRWAGKDRQSGWAVDQVTDYGYKDPKKVREAIESHNREGSDHPYTAILVKKFPSHKDNEAYKVGDSQKISSGAGSDALSKTASRLQNKGITGQEAIENHLKGLSSTRRNRLAKELGIEGRGADKIKAMASKISEQQGGKGQQKIDKEDINNAKSRLDTYKNQLKDVQDEIADAESIRPSLRHPDYDKNVASLKQKEANLKKWIKDDEELTAKEKQIANSKANARIREAEQQIRDIENGKSGNKQYWENEKKQAEKDLLASQTANSNNTPQFKTRDEAEEYYVDYYSKLSPAERNKLAKRMGTGGKGVDRVMAMAMNKSNDFDLPYEKHDDEDFHKSWERISNRNDRLREIATKNMNAQKSKEDTVRQKLKAREAAAFERDKASAKQNLDSLKAALKEHPDDIHTNYIKERLKAAEAHYAAFKKGKYPESPEFKTAKEWDEIDKKKENNSTSKPNAVMTTKPTSTRDAKLKDLGSNREEAIAALRNLTGSSPEALNKMVDEVDEGELIDAIRSYRKSQARQKGIKATPLSTPDVKLLRDLNSPKSGKGILQAGEFLRKNPSKQLVMTAGPKEYFIKYAGNGKYEVAQFSSGSVYGHKYSNSVTYMSDDEIFKLMDRPKDKKFKFKGK